MAETTGAVGPNDPFDADIQHDGMGNSPRRVIDLGTGTGIWAIDFGDQFPSAEDIGTDLSPTQPSLVPQNVGFLVDDMEDEWTYENKFDFIHARFLASSLKDYKKVLKQCYNNTVPGGWVEFQDWDMYTYSEDGTLKDAYLERYNKEVTEGFKKAGYVVSPGPHLEAWFPEAGFQNIHVQKYRVPLGTWPKDQHYAESVFEAAAMAVLTRFQGWSKDEVTVLVARTKEDAKNPKIHSMFDFYVVYGQRPE
ncbi:hypothetical protein T310_0818 [Rasamsonia emersonii CBS 393.64]|uniref:Methyltransferase n=1 Tax=Rasamsonia emersonii (strain ATCC 16479 / CBS 393.64 / IMI 116815) TaxID=1408163 RepID=A0A0F4Z5E8_RASE3|nr:hypothetical protein T310_0818 [Rasamsonia emersonii CBS 393.64]KKA25113.1 hypothetical protein T310_0818 [Rasamsonia emersonii CBS 393.64]